MSSPILITGATGRIGSALAAHFRKRGREVIGISRSGAPGFLSWDELLISPLLRQPGTLIHCAWSTVPKTAEENPASLWLEDLPPLARLASMLSARAGQPAPNLIFLSSGGAIYGEGQPDMPKTEADTARPIGWYGMGKFAAEQLITTFQQRTGWPATILRISNLYGFAHDPAKPQGLIAAALHAAHHGLSLPVWGQDGSMRKDYLHLDDFCPAMEHFLDGAHPGTYNLCTGTSTTVDTIVALVEKITSRPLPQHFQPGPAWDVRCSVLSPAKCQAATGWQARINVEEGMLKAES